MNFNFGGSSGGDKKPNAFSFGNTSTPAATNSATNLFGNQPSTTPAGAPPASGFSFGGNNAGGSLFGAQQKNENTPLFGSGGAVNTPALSFGSNAGNTSTPAAENKPAFSFGAAANPNAAGASGFSFNSKTEPAAPTVNASSGATATGTATTGFNFGGSTEPKPVEVSKPAGFSFGSSSNAQSSAPKPTGFTLQSTTAKAEPAKTGGFSFGNTTKADDTKPAGGFSFGKPAEKEASKTDDSKGTTGFSFGKPEEKKTESTTTAPGSFSFGAAKAEDKKDSTAPKFSFGGKAEDKPAIPASDQAPTTADKKEAPATGGFSFGTKPEEKKDSAAASTSTKPGAASTANAPPPNILKNKTMEDVINKWSADLDKYSKEFQKQAKEISSWDQSLLTSGDQISRLYAATVEAEQSSGKVDQALNYIENQQDELSQLLDTYESQVRDMSADAGLNQPADQEREKAYQQAEALINDLEATNKSIMQLTEELNTSTATLSRLSEDDPLSSIVKILNTQVQTLSWIDVNANKLSSKVDSIQHAQSNSQSSPRTPGGTKYKFGSLRLD